MNLELIDRTLEVTENPGLDTLDPRFGDITTLVQNGEYLEAAAQAEAVLNENIYDIRIIGYFLYGVFLDQGLVAVAGIFQCLSRLLQENWQAVGPVKKREKHGQTSLNWLMKMLLKKMQYEEEKKEEGWNQWVDQVSSDQVQETLDAGDGLRRSISMALEDAAAPVLDGLIKVNDWLGAFQKVVYREPEPEPESDDMQGQEGEAEETQEEETQEKASGASAGTIAAASVGGDAAYTEGSYHLQVLLRKLEAFDRLIAKGKMPLAALVANDINDTIAHFDPKVYFPRLFSRFALLFALHIGELASFEEAKKSVAWKALSELYKVDLNAFVEFDLDGMSFDAPMGNGGADQGDEEEDTESSSDSQDDDNDHEKQSEW